MPKARGSRDLKFSNLGGLGLWAQDVSGLLRGVDSPLLHGFPCRRDAVLRQVAAFAVHRARIRAGHVNAEVFVRDGQGCPNVSAMPQVKLVEALIQWHEGSRLLLHQSSQEQEAAFLN